MRSMCNWLTKEEFLGKLPTIRSLLVFLPISSSAPPTLLTKPQRVISVWAHRGVCREGMPLCVLTHARHAKSFLFQQPSSEDTKGTPALFTLDLVSSGGPWTGSRCGIRAVTLGKAKKWPQDYINYILLYHNTVQGVLYYLNVSHNLTFVHIILISI